MSVIETLTSLVQKLPADAITTLIAIVRGALSADDPGRYLARAAQAAAAHKAAQGAVSQALKSRKRKA